MSNPDQDWTPVVITKKVTTKPTSEAALAKAKASGDVETVKKYSGPAVPNAQKLDAETTDFHHQTVTLDFQMALQQARTAKGWSQKDLAGKINEKATVINDYESGRAIPNQEIIGKLSRVLGVKLPKLPKVKKTKDDEEK